MNWIIKNTEPFYSFISISSIDMLDVTMIRTVDQLNLFCGHFIIAQA